MLGDLTHDLLIHLALRAIPSFMLNFSMHHRKFLACRGKVATLVT